MLYMEAVKIQVLDKENYARANMRLINQSYTNHLNDLCPYADNPLNVVEKFSAMVPSEMPVAGLMRRNLERNGFSFQNI